MAGGDGINPLVRSAVRASSIQQECADILLVKFGNTRRVNHRLQTARPEGVSSLHRVVKWTHACEVACQNGGAVGLILYDDAPIAYQMDKAVGPPSFEGG